MMQNPLLGYSSFSHFLDLRNQQYSSSTRPPTSATTATSNSISPPPLFMYNHNTFRQPSMTPINNDSTLSGSPSPNNAKSFTIDAILGLRDGQSAGRLECAGNAGAKYSHTATDLSINSSRCVNNKRNSNGQQHQQQQSERQLVAPSLSQGSNFNGNCVRRAHEKSVDVLTNSASKKGGKSKRVRTIFTPEQLERLEAEFERQQYMVGPERLYLAHALQLTEAQVKVWFQNRRIKWRKQHLEMQQQRLAVIKQQQTLQQQQYRGVGEEPEDSDMESNSGDDICFAPSATTPTSAPPSSVDV